jgi:hypothetical protein
MNTQDWNDVGRLLAAMFYAALDTIGPEAGRVACESAPIQQ